jgi:hypothetical protein
MPRFNKHIRPIHGFKELVAVVAKALAKELYWNLNIEKRMLMIDIANQRIHTSDLCNTKRQSLFI